MATMELVAKRRCSANSLDEWGSEVWTEGEMNTAQGQEPQPPRPPLFKHGSRPGTSREPKPGLQVSFSGLDVTNTTSKRAELAPSVVSQVSISKIQMGDVIMERDLEMIDGVDPWEKGTHPPVLPPPLCACTDHPPGGSLEIKPSSEDKEETVGRGIEDGLATTEARPTNHSPLNRDSFDDVFLTESQEDTESTLSSEGDENQSVDSKPLNIDSARKQWVRLDSTSSKPPLPQLEQPKNISRSASPGQPEDLAQAHHVVTPNELQRELSSQGATAAIRPRRKREVEAQQVLKGATPTRSLATVTKEPANPVEGGLPSSVCDVKAWAGGERRHTGEGRERGGSRLGGAAGEAEGKKGQGVKGFKRAAQKQTEGRKTTPGVKSRGGRRRTSRMELVGDVFDDSQSDSGVSADFSPGSTTEFHAPASPTSLTQPPASETPIEKEIRRALEREQSLRKARGLHIKPPALEYVDIPLKTSILTQTLPSRSDRSQVGKERQFAGKIMQKEINEETQREEVLVQLGKVRGSYYKGTVRQLKERKKMFEVFQDPKDMFLMLSPCGNASSWASTSDLSAQDIQRDGSSSVSDGERSLAELIPGPSGTAKGFPYTPPGTSAPRGPSLSESAGGQIIILENHNHLVLPAPAHHLPPVRPLASSHSGGAHCKTPAAAVVSSTPLYSSSTRMSGEERRGSCRDEDEVKTGEEEEDDVPKENPFFKLRSSSASQDKVEQDIREAWERERELRRQRSSLYGGGGAGVGGGEGPAGEELQDPAGCPSTPPFQNNGLATPDLLITPISRRASATQTGRQSLGKLGLWPPPQTDDSSDSQSEGLQSPRAPRQKAALLQRWESGMVTNGTGAEEED